MKKINMEGQLDLFSEADFEEKETQSKSGDIAQKTKSNFLRQEPQETRPRTKEFNLHPLFRQLAQSDFRSRFHLKPNDIAYIREKGLEVIAQHAADFVAKRLAPAVIPNDGKQTPMRGHPVFLAQHATACCCRGCFYKWHHIPPGRPLTVAEQQYAVSVLMTWIEREYNKYK